MDLAPEGETPVRRDTVYHSTCSLSYPLGFWVAGEENPPVIFYAAATCTLTSKCLLHVSNAQSSMKAGETKASIKLQCCHSVSYCCDHFLVFSARLDLMKDAIALTLETKSTSILVF